MATVATPLIGFQGTIAKANGALLGISFAGESITVSLLDNPTARDLASMLPLDITIEDYSTNEKIVRLPRRLTEEGKAPFGDEAPGDLCYYAPWGNLALFYAGYRYSEGLIRLGRMENWQQPLRRRGTFPVRITRFTP